MILVVRHVLRSSQRKSSQRLMGLIRSNHLLLNLEKLPFSNDVVEKSNVGNLKLTINTTGKSLKLKGIIITANENVMVERYDNEAVEINKRSSKCALKDFLPQILRMTIPRKHPISLPATIFRISSLMTRML